MSNNETISTILSTYHDLKAISIIRSFVSKTGDFFGANKTEKHQLEIAAEEASAFIINSLKPDKNMLFEIEAQPIQSGLRFHFHSRGMPIDDENLPTYDNRDPEASIEGLPFFLLENLSDALWFKNRGNDGWVLVFEKRFKDFLPLEEQQEVDEETLNIHAKERVKVSIATKEDAYDIIKLTYLTYRYSYAKSIFYYRKELEKAIESGDVVVFVGKNSNNEVVICSAYLRSKNSNSIMELGMLMNKPEYKKNSALLIIVKRQIRYLKENDTGLKIAYINLVTAHTRSQRLSKHFSFMPTALKLSIHDRADFIGIDVANKARESLLYAINIPCGLDPITLHLPKEHIEITKKLLDSFEFISFSTKSEEIEQKESKFEVEIDKKNRYAQVTIEVFGKNWLKELKNHIKSFRNDEAITIYIKTPTHQKLSPNFEKDMKSIGAFYSGVMIKTTKEWELLYTILEGQHFDFNLIQLENQNAIELREYMQNEFQNQD